MGCNETPNPNQGTSEYAAADLNGRPAPVAISVPFINGRWLAQPRLAILSHGNSGTKSMKITYTKGFSLTELMITVAVMAILLMVAVPSFTELIARNRLAAASNDLLSSLMFARAEAVRTSQVVSVCRVATADSDVCIANGAWDRWIVTSDPTGVTANATLRRGEINTPAAIRSVAGWNGRIDFGSAGRLNVGMAANTIRLCSSAINTNNVRTFSFNIAGRATVQTTTGACP